jgi:predicted nucleotidyltransferase
MLDRLIEQRDAIGELCRRFGVERLAAFGSALTDQFDPQRSDVDFLVEFEAAGSVSRFDAFFGLKEGLEGLLGHSVDLVAPAALENPYFAQSFEDTRQELYAA